MRQRKNGISIGSLLAIVLAAIAALGTFYFIRIVASDSPVAAMNFSEIVDAFGKPFKTVDDQYPETAVSIISNSPNSAVSTAP